MPDLDDGETFEMQGSGAKPYVIKNVGGVYSCSCPAWRNQSEAIERRSCKHIRKLRGDAAEEARIGGALPQKPAAAAGEDGEAPPVLLAESWDNAADLAGWWMSEKLDGVRAYWDGEQFLSRQGNLFHAPDWFVEGLPNAPLDGELWIARKAFQRTVGIVRRQDKPDLWKEVRYLVFDAPARTGPFEERLEHVRTRFKHTQPKYAVAHAHILCTGVEHLRKELARIEALGGEGLMLRQPGSAYVAGRSTTLLKVKSFLDAEAVVIGHEAGEGRHKGRLGAVMVRLPNGKEFKVGTGFTDKERAAPPAIGATITFRYQELSDGGIPRFPSYLRVRTDAPLPPEPLAASPPPAPRTHKRQPETVPPAPPPAPVAAKGKRYFECVEDGSSKFWEVWVEDKDLKTRWGKIGTDGCITTKTFATPEKAQLEAEKLTKEKLGKGYEEK